MSNQLIEANENPLSKFDGPVLKGMGSTQLDAAAPRAMFLPSNMGEAMELAKLMAAGNFVPPHLRGKAGDCLAVVMQATRWAMDPFAVAGKTYFVNDRMAYESQLVNAVINSANVLDGRLHPVWSGSGNELCCTVSGKLKGDPEVKIRRVEIKTIKTRNSPLWLQDPEQQIAYFTMRAWVRLHAPEVLLGVYTKDELEALEPQGQPAPIHKPLSAAMLTAQASGDNQKIETIEGDVSEVVDDEPAQSAIPEWISEETLIQDALHHAGDRLSIEEVERQFLAKKALFPAEVAAKMQAAIDEKIIALASEED